MVYSLKGSNTFINIYSGCFPGLAFEGSTNPASGERCDSIEKSEDHTGVGGPLAEVQSNPADESKRFPVEPREDGLRSGLKIG
jgi:hypothetical protein